MQNKNADYTNSFSRFCAAANSVAFGSRTIGIRDFRPVFQPTLGASDSLSASKARASAGTIAADLVYIRGANRFAEFSTTELLVSKFNNDDY